MQLITLNPRQRKAAQLLAAGLSRNEAAQRVGINPATLSLWRRIPAFNRQIERLLGGQDSEAIQVLYVLKLKAVERLATLLDDPNPNVCLRAVDLILQKTLSAYPVPAAEEMTPGGRAWVVMQQELERIANQTRTEDPANA